MCNANQDSSLQTGRRLPPWLTRPMPAGGAYANINALLNRLKLNTVCRSAGCPNLGQCWSAGTATFMIAGSVCTRNCLFCAVQSGTPQVLDLDEPEHLAQAAKQMKLKHVVITSVTRDDLPDGAAGHFVACINTGRAALPHAAIEVLTPDFSGRADILQTVHRAGPTIFNHNLETVQALTRKIRPQADYQRSLGVLSWMARAGGMWIKSGLMAGLGETDQQVLDTLADLRNAGCQIITIGQYLAPSKGHYPVQRYLEPAWFDQIRDQALAMGFNAVFAGPFVRSSYMADKLHSQALGG